MSLHQPLLATYGDRLIKVESATFDGTNDYMTRGGALTGVVDGTKGILSFWIFFNNAIDGNEYYVLSGCTALGGPVARVRVYRTATNGYLNVQGYTSAGALTLDIRTSATFGVSSSWVHFLSSWDVSATTATIYINDASDLVTNTNANNNINYAEADWGIGAIAAGSSKLNANLAELYFNPAAYMDFSVTSNRRKFISSGKRPVWLGADGSNPTGSQPAVFQHLGSGDAATSFATNYGAGGNFTITGALTLGANSPSD